MEENELHYLLIYKLLYLGIYIDFLLCELYIINFFYILYSSNNVLFDVPAPTSTNLKQWHTILDMILTMTLDMTIQVDISNG